MLGVNVGKQDWVRVAAQCLGVIHRDVVEEGGLGGFYDELQLQGPDFVIPNTDPAHADDAHMSHMTYTGFVHAFVHLSCSVTNNVFGDGAEMDDFLQVRREEEGGGGHTVYSVVAVL